jgi:hypothetical protein
VKILLDEGVPDLIQSWLKSLTIATVQELGWRGIRNGHLLDLMAENGFELLITTDKNIPYQQNLAKRNLSAIIIPSNRIRILKPLLPQIQTAIKTIKLGEAIEIPYPRVT